MFLLTNDGTHTALYKNCNLTTEDLNNLLYGPHQKLRSKCIRYKGNNRSIGVLMYSHTKFIAKFSESYHKHLENFSTLMKHQIKTIFA